jgi:Protein of unknown function (DUF3313)
LRVPILPAIRAHVKGSWRITPLLLAVVVVLGCEAAKVKSVVRPAMSGFLDDYSRLQAGSEDELRWVYRNPSVDWQRYDGVILDAVTLWRAGKDSLGRVPEGDLQRLVNLFQRTLLDRLGNGLRLVDEPGPNVMRIRLAITEASGDDQVLDVFTATDDERPSDDTGALDPETQAFVAGGVIEGEIRDAENDALLAQGIDRRRDDGEPATTWAELHTRLRRWVDQTVGRLEARTAASPVR